MDVSNASSVTGGEWWTTGAYVGWSYRDFVEVLHMPLRFVRLQQDLAALQRRMVALGKG
jgi:hypothetical protein